MKFNRLLVMGSLLVMSLSVLATAARADGVSDPLMGVGKTDPPFVPASINTPLFSISDSNGISPSEDPDGNPILGGSACVVTPPGAPNGTSSGCYFENDISEDGNPLNITGLTFDVPVPFGGDTCPGDSFMLGAVTVASVFSTCTPSEDSSGGTIFAFSGGTIGYRDDFFVAIDFPNAPNGIVASGVATLPEPGTFGLLGLGLSLVFLGLNRKRLSGLAG